jgi:hypothetical protein
MNYKAQLKGWAIDRAIEFKKIDPEANIFDLAGELIEYCYTPDKDMEGHISYLFELVRKLGDETKIDAIIGALDHIKEDMRRAEMMKNSSVVANA